MIRPRFFSFLSAVLILNACVSLEQLPPGSVVIQPSSPVPVRSTAALPFAPPVGAISERGLRCEVYAVNPQTSRSALDACERVYLELETNLSLPVVSGSRTIRLIFYPNSAEFLDKTNQPGTSTAVVIDNTLVTYPRPDLSGFLSYPLTRMLLRERFPNLGPESEWLSEGVAIYEEKRLGDAPGSTSAETLPVDRPFPLEMLISFVPATPDRSAAPNWYAQAQSVVDHMIDRGGERRFAQFLSDVSAFGSLDRALMENYPETFPSLQDLNQSWKTSLPYTTTSS